MNLMHTLKALFLMILTVLPMFGADVSETLPLGKSIILYAESDGVPSPVFEWYKDGVKISDSYSLVMVLQKTDSGSYQVKAINSEGFALSDKYILTVSDFTEVNIAQQPVNANVMPGGTATFSVVASGSGPYTYQWLKNGTPIPGATDATLTVTDIQKEGDMYYVNVSNPVDTEQSNVAYTLFYIFPEMTVNPISIAVNLGEPAVFNCGANGNDVVYQWYHNGVPVPNSNSRQLLIQSVTASDTGAYYATATNPMGTSTSSTAILTFSGLNAPIFALQPSSQSVPAGSMITFQSSASGTEPITYQWFKDGLVVSGAINKDLTLLNVSSSDIGSYYVVATNSIGTAQSNTVNLNVTIPSVPPVFATHPTNQNVTAGATATFTSSATGTAPIIYQWFKDGTPLTGATSTDLVIANVAVSNVGTYYVTATNVAGSAQSLSAVLTVNIPAVAPVFALQPQSQTVLPYSNVTFTSSATGSPTPTYLWYKNGTPVAEWNTPSITLNTVTTNDETSYYVVATNSAGAVQSNIVTLTLFTAPVFATHPTSQTVDTGVTVEFTASATSNPAPTYQWLKDNSILNGATSNKLILTNVTTGNSGEYKVVAANSVATTISNPATLVVREPVTPPVIAQQPVSQKIKINTSFTVSIDVVNKTGIAYQWLKNGVEIPGATQAAYTVVSAQKSDAATYNAIAKNTAGEVKSYDALIIVLYPPVFTTQPAAKTTAAINSTTTIQGIVDSNPPANLQWNKNNIPVAGAVSDALTFPSVQLTDAGTYNLVASNSEGTKISDNAILEIGSMPLIVTALKNINAPRRSDVQFYVVASGSNLTYRWYRNNILIQGETTDRLTLRWLQNKDAGTYKVVVSNAFGTAQSVATLTVR